MLLLCVFFFFKQKTAYEMRISDWSSDVCSSDLLFATRVGKDTALFRSHIAGLQRYLPTVMPLLAPNVNSYRRLMPDYDAPINTHWGYDNRTVGLRVPNSDAASRRVENRLAGADANPYLAIAASLACGYLGMKEKLKPRQPIPGRSEEHTSELQTLMRTPYADF